MYDRQSKVYLGVILVAVLACVGMLLIDRFAPTVADGTVPPPIVWYDTTITEPPDNVPIIGFWMDGDREDVESVICAGEQYYENTYDGATCLLYGYPPLYWSYLPNSAR